MSPVELVLKQPSVPSVRVGRPCISCCKVRRLRFCWCRAERYSPRKSTHIGPHSCSTEPMQPALYRPRLLCRRAYSRTVSARELRRGESPQLCSTRSLCPRYFRASRRRSGSARARYAPSSECNRGKQSLFTSCARGCVFFTTTRRTANSFWLA